MFLATDDRMFLETDDRWTLICKTGRSYVSLVLQGISFGSGGQKPFFFIDERKVAC